MIYVVRHGETDFNKEGRLQGRNGLPLNEDGQKQAERLRDLFKEITFDYVFSSPQKRAMQTAEIITGMQPIIEPRLDVFDLGEADGLKKHEIQLDGILPDRNVYKRMEDIQVFMKRVFSFMGDLEQKSGAEDVNILLSGHRCTTGSIGAYFEGVPEDRNILRFSSNNGDYKKYKFTRKRTEDEIISQ
ncbi:histidine phosphatase family protein [Bacillus sp. Marseille-Q1617]|uniref:histidine phosphatase family protein n=1 Tax=Bacillus sp. Marseille-Q1617 TaxID=2736887 RepID=UPI00158EB80C|nr:histidine phosphatase family protein [Bacillus sp. Marseille-Q1617]